jgi:hypothetical protein
MVFQRMLRCVGRAARVLAVVGLALLVSCQLVTACGALPVVTLPDAIVDCTVMRTPPLTLLVHSADAATCPVTTFRTALRCRPALVNVQGFPSSVAPAPGGAAVLRFTFAARLPSKFAATLAALPCTMYVNGTVPAYGDPFLNLLLANCSCAPLPPVLSVRPRSDAVRGVVVTARNVASPTCADAAGVFAVNDTRVRPVNANTSFAFTRGYNETASATFNVSGDAPPALPLLCAAALNTGILAMSDGVEV